MTNNTTQAPIGADALRHALEIAEAALADIGDADREPGDDVAWCEARAAEALPTVRAALASAAQPAAAPSLLAADHKGWKVDYSGLVAQARRALRDEAGLAELIRQLGGHLEKLGKRWYAGDTAAVDEFLQLYCIESEAREALAAAPKAAPAAQGDACDAKHIAALTEIVRMPNAEHVADAHNAAVKYLRARAAKEGGKT